MSRSINIDDVGGSLLLMYWVMSIFMTLQVMGMIEWQWWKLASPLLLWNAVAVSYVVVGWILNEER